MPAEESYLASAAYGSAAFIEAGAYWPPEVREAARETYDLLEHALTLLEHEGIVGRSCWLVLLSPYLSDPADPSLVARWRKEKPRLADWHDLAIRKLAGYLAAQNLFVMFPSRMTSGEERQIERRNAELYTVYQEMRAEGRRKSEAVELAAEFCGYSVRRAWDIVGAREPKG
jgi:hypothetical protein